MAVKPSLRVRRLVLVIGIIITVGALIWWTEFFNLASDVRGGYRSRWEMLLAYGALLCGPVSALPAGVCMRWFPKAGAVWFLIAGAVSTAMLSTLVGMRATRSFPITMGGGDAHGGLLLFSLAMVGVGIWLCIATRKYEPSVTPHAIKD